MSEADKNEPLSVLLDARALISDPARWVQRTPARNKKGTPTDPTSLTACAWCVMGAIHKAANDGHYSPLSALRATRALSRRCAEYVVLAEASVVSFNDHPRRKHQEVLHVLDAAIAELRGTAS